MPLDQHIEGGHGERQPGVKRKLLWEDPATQRRAIMNRIEPHAQFARHRHAGDELVFVIEGALSDEFGTITAGPMGYRPHGCIHTLSTPQGAPAVSLASQCGSALHVMLG